MGMTWNTQVSHRVQGSNSRRLLTVGRPSTRYSTPTIQWPVITAPMDTARRKST